MKTAEKDDSITCGECKKMFNFQHLKAFMQHKMTNCVDAIKNNGASGDNDDKKHSTLLNVAQTENGDHAENGLKTVYLNGNSVETERNITKLTNDFSENSSMLNDHGSDEDEEDDDEDSTQEDDLEERSMF